MNICTLLTCISLSITLFTAIESEIQKVGTEMRSKSIIQTIGKKHRLNKYTKKQEGKFWCFYSCAQGLLKYNNVEIKQSKLFKLFIGKSPEWFWITRKVCPKTIVEDNIINNINLILKENNISKSLNYWKITFAKWPKSMTKEELDKHLRNGVSRKKWLKTKIIKFYQENGKQPFCSYDSIFKNHAVNIISIDEDNEEITIEDPQSGISRVEKLEEYCRKIILIRNDIELITISDNSNNKNLSYKKYCNKIIGRKQKNKNITIENNKQTS